MDQDNATLIDNQPESNGWSNNTSCDRDTIINDYFKKSCEECMESLKHTSSADDGELHCPSLFDDYSCISETKAGMRLWIECPPLGITLAGRLLAYRDCTSDGTWAFNSDGKSITTYDDCIGGEAYEMTRTVTKIYISGFTLSILCLIPALFIFCFYKQLHCGRITIHKNLFVTYILYGTASIVQHVITEDHILLNSNPDWCKALHVIQQYLILCNYHWMFNEGFFLHTTLVSTFCTTRRLVITCLLIGWVMPLLFISLYTGFKIGSSNSACWLDSEKWQMWFIDAPVIVTLLANIIFMINVVRILVSKLRAYNDSGSNVTRTRKVARAIAILIPLLGLHQVLMPIAPDPDSSFYNVHRIAAALAISLQGFTVGLIFCFLNGEVISLFKKRINQRRMSLSVTQKYETRAQTNYTRTSSLTPPQAVVFQEDIPLTISPTT